MSNQPNISTLGELVKSGYQSLSVKEELRKNLIHQLKNNLNVFEGILGYEDTVIPAIERAILSGHNINLLGLRGQAKTRIARQMVHLLDEWVPVIKGSELNEDPLRPIINSSKSLVSELGDALPIEWLHRSERYVEKLATPDVSIADLIGDIDPIKASNLKISFSNENAIHYGLIPRSHRSIFVINELPDLQPRIQVALFNILQEGDMQIRGFKLRLNLDIQFVFTANPEDYTNRGSIITPLKDRIGSQILTHYPKSIETAKSVTKQEARLSDFQRQNIDVPEFISTILENIAFKARESEFVDHKSGVSARMSITSFENLMSMVERRMLLNNEEKGVVRVADFAGIIPSITGKIEMVYEGEQEGPYNVAVSLIIQSIKQVFTDMIPNVTKLRKKGKEAGPDYFREVIEWFEKGNTLNIYSDMSEKDYAKKINAIPGLDDLIEKQKDLIINDQERVVVKELILHGLASISRLNRKEIETGYSFGDLFASMMQGGAEG
jgi:magnesium chelatase subunit I